MTDGAELRSPLSKVNPAPHRKAAGRLIVIVAYLATSFLNFGALNAANRYGRHWRTPDAVAVEAFIALIPASGTVTAIFDTEFGEHGFSWKIGCDANDRH